MSLASTTACGYVHSCRSLRLASVVRASQLPARLSRTGSGSLSGSVYCYLSLFRFWMSLFCQLCMYPILTMMESVMRVDDSYFTLPSNSSFLPSGNISQRIRNLVDFFLLRKYFLVILIQESVRNRTKVGPISVTFLSTFWFQIRSRNRSLFWSRNGPKIWSKIWPIFWSKFRSNFGPIFWPIFAPPFLDRFLEGDFATCPVRRGRNDHSLVYTHLPPPNF